MYFEVELLRKVAVLAKNLDQKALDSQRYIVTQLLKSLSSEKAMQDQGYFLAVTGLKSIGKGQAAEGESGYVYIPVAFTCRTFMPLPGEILQGVVHHICRLGAYMSCGPVRIAYLSGRKMPGYHFVDGETPSFQNADLSKIMVDVVVLFVVLDVRWIERREDRSKELQMLASLEGDNLGPISSCEL